MFKKIFVSSERQHHNKMLAAHLERSSGATANGTGFDSGGEDVTVGGVGVDTGGMGFGGVVETEVL